MDAVRLQIGGMGCAACAVQIEDALRVLPGLATVRIDPATAEARLRMDRDVTGLDAVLREIRRLGYTASVAGSDSALGERTVERRRALKRLVVSGFGMMQAMMFAFALYAGAEYRMDPALEDFMRYCSLLVALPVAVYAGGPIFRAAAYQLRNRRPAMDVPVSLGVGTALLASVWNTFAGGGVVYYDAVTMFIFFLTASRFVEMTSRHQVGTVTEALAWLLPREALRIHAGVTSAVPVGVLRAGDEILVNQGDAVAADGHIAAGASTFDESCLTGESAPVPRQAGDAVMSGSINLGPGVRVRVTATGEQTELAAVLRLLERSRRAKPAILGLADRAARFFSLAIVLIAGLVCIAWLVVRPEAALASTVAVLVVACPCALSLAAPSVLASAHGALARLGLLPVSATALEQLVTVRQVLLDKTGTLTVGHPVVQMLDGAAPESASPWLAVAAALERGSSHPLAVAFRRHELPSVVAGKLREVPGEGVEGIVDGRLYRLGQPGFVLALAVPGSADQAAAAGDLLLGDATGPKARFTVRDAVRPDAQEAMALLRRQGLHIEIASGDAPEAVQQVAAELGVERWQARMTPAAKVARLRALRAGGKAVLMVGDGVNDAPVAAEADVSIVMRSGSALAQTSGDLLLLDGAWPAVPRAIGVAHRARRILRQNLGWSMFYNLAAIPLAALGYLPPWLAALGMSLSSMLVVLNARRVRA